jgi:hypothetical protein
MKEFLQVLGGIVAGLVVNAITEKNRFAGYGIEAFKIGSIRLGWDDVALFGIGIVLMIPKASREFGIGIFSGMLYTKFAESYSLPSFRL